jgi:superfamily II DNA or RNA helicase
MMVKVISNNARSQLECGYELLQEARAHMSYKVKGAEFATAASPYWDGTIKLMNREGFFPTGLIGHLKTFLDAKGMKMTLEDQRYVPKPSLSLKLTLPHGWAPRNYQLTARSKAEELPRGVFVMGTGAGKSLTSALIVELKQVPTLIVVPDTGLREQLTEDYRNWFGHRKIGNKLTDDCPIIISNIQAIQKKPKEDFKRFEMLMIDEFHHAAADTYKDINNNCSNAYYRYGFTGTFVRPDGSDMEMLGVLSNVLFKKSTSELIEEGYLVRPYITIFHYDLRESNAGKRMRMRYQDAYKFCTIDAKINTGIAAIANQKIKEGKQTLVLVRLKEHGELLHRLIPDAYYLSGSDGRDHREKVKRAFIQRKVKCIIATNIFGEGQDIPSIDALINARFQKTEIQTFQGIGRALRKTEGKDKAEVFDFFFVGHKNLEDHSVERLNTYRRESAFKIQVRRAKF